MVPAVTLPILLVLTAPLSARAGDSAALEPHPGFERRFLHVAWNGFDREVLRGLRVEAETSVEVSPLGSGEIGAWIAFDVAPGADERLTGRLLERVQAASRLSGETPRLAVAAPDEADLRCEREGQAVSRGICLAGVSVSPGGRSDLEFQLTFRGFALVRDVALRSLQVTAAPGGALTVERVRADLLLTGGDESSRVAVRELLAAERAPAPRGRVEARLAAVGRMDLRSIAGPVFVDLLRPASSRVTLDGQAIEKFPYERP